MRPLFTTLTLAAMTNLLQAQVQDKPTTICHEPQSYVIKQDTKLGHFILHTIEDADTLVVGYIDQGDIDPTQIPDELRQMLELYTVKTKATLSAATQHNTITPLIKTQWGQSYPYNLLTPKKCVTGCVSTAFAQVLKYYGHPKSAEGKYTTVSGIYSYSTQLGTYNWDKMTNTYPSENADSLAAYSVATIMRDLGYTFKASYGKNSTSTSVYDALSPMVKAWDYDQSIYYANRKYYSDESWDELIYHELESKRPVVMTAESKDGSNGHAFIIDGYDKKLGLYHVNWGWGGYCDGYFNLTFSSADDLDYSSDQMAVVGIQPTTDQFEVRLETVEIKQWKLPNAYVKPGTKVSFYGAIGNVSGHTASFSTGLKMTNKQTGEATIIDGPVANNYNHDSYIRFDVKLDANSLPQGVPLQFDLIYWTDRKEDYHFIPCPASLRQREVIIADYDIDPNQEIEYYPRTNVTEMMVRTGCAYSTLTYSIMDILRQKYPDTYIPIAVHVQNTPIIAFDYELYLDSTPLAYYNRELQSSGYAAINQEHIEKFLKSSDKSNAEIKIESAKYDNTQHRIVVKTKSRFGFNADNRDYRIAYVFTEDSVGPYLQNNYAYYNAEHDPLHYGWDTLPSQVSCYLNYVVRSITPSMSGLEGAIPSTVEKGKYYTTEYTVPLPLKVQDPNKLHLIVMLLDQYTGQVVNAHMIQAPNNDGRGCIREVTVKTPGTLKELLGEDWVYVNSLKVSGTINYEDVGLIRAMSGLKNLSSSTATENYGMLHHLDLTDATILGGGLVSEDYNMNTHEQPANGIAHSTFYPRCSLSSIKLPKNLVTIGYNAFYYSNIKEIYLPASLHYCASLPMDLDKIELDPANPYYEWVDGHALYSKMRDTLLCVTPGLKQSKFVSDVACEFAIMGNIHLEECDTVVFANVLNNEGKLHAKSHVKHLFWNNMREMEIEADTIENLYSLYYYGLYSGTFTAVGRFYVQRDRIDYIKSDYYSKKYADRTFVIEDADFCYDSRKLIVPAEYSGEIKESISVPCCISDMKLLDKDVEWSVENNDIGRLSSTGYFYGYKPGVVNITAKLAGTDITATCRVTITDPATGISEVPADAASADEPADIFTIDGRTQTDLRPGLNIVRYRNGTYRKIMVQP